MSSANDRLRKESLMPWSRRWRPTLGYDKRVRPGPRPRTKSGTTLKEEAIRLGFVDEETFDRGRGAAPKT